jgi:3-hydroxyacyl-CoA dehydrogenase
MTTAPYQATFAAATLRIDGDIAVLSVNHPPVNALSQVVRQGLLEGLRPPRRAPRSRPWC